MSLNIIINCKQYDIKIMGGNMCNHILEEGHVYNNKATKIFKRLTHNLTKNTINNTVILIG